MNAVSNFVCLEDGHEILGMTETDEGIERLWEIDGPREKQLVQRNGWSER